MPLLPSKDLTVAFSLGRPLLLPPALSFLLCSCASISFCQKKMKEKPRLMEGNGDVTVSSSAQPAQSTRSADSGLTWARVRDGAEALISPRAVTAGRSLPRPEQTQGAQERDAALPNQIRCKAHVHPASSSSLYHKVQETPSRHVWKTSTTREFPFAPPARGYLPPGGNTTAPGSGEVIHEAFPNLGCCTHGLREDLRVSSL